MPDTEDEEISIDVVDSELVAQSMVGHTILRGGCPYRVDRYVPVAELRWELRGVGLPVHGSADH